MRILILFIGITSFLKINAQEHFVHLNKNEFAKGEIISINCLLNSFKKDSIHFASLYLFIENIETKAKWQYRYPLLSGVTEAELSIDSNMQTGRYAFTFVARKAFFSMNGSVENGDEMDFSFSMQLPNNKEMVKPFKTDQNGNFYIPGLLFADSSLFTFFPTKPIPDKFFEVEITTILDSTFIPEYMQTIFISVGQEKNENKNGKDYTFNMHEFMLNQKWMEKETEIKMDKTNVPIYTSTQLRAQPVQNASISKQSELRTVNGSPTGYVVNWNGIVESKLRPDLDMVPQKITSPAKRSSGLIPIKSGPLYMSNKFMVFGYTPVEMVWK